MHDVILIEDDDALRDYLCEGLSKAGYDVRDAGGGALGLALFRERAANIVVTDLILDDGEGVETLIQLRGAEPPPLLIAISGNPLYLSHSLKLGAQKALLKPFTMDGLLDAVEERPRKWDPRRVNGTNDRRYDSG
ncbi:MAG: response regulator [Rhodospirillaceae bacterium]